MEIKIRCKKHFEMETIDGRKTGMMIGKGRTGAAIKSPIGNGKFFYTCEINGYMFDMKQQSFDAYMTEIA